MCRCWAGRWRPREVWRQPPYNSPAPRALSTGVGAPRGQDPELWGRQWNRKAWVGSEGAECSFGFNLVWGLSRGLSPEVEMLITHPASGD